MKATFRTCPHCQARNKPTWEFCARCGEALEIDLAELESDNAEAGEAAFDDEAEPRPASGGNPLRDLVVLAALLVAGIASYQWWRGGAPAVPVATGFVTAATLPSRNVTPVNAVVAPAGEEAFAQGRALLARGDAAGALPLLAQAVQLSPDVATYRGLYGDALIATGAVDEGLGQYDAAVRLDPVNSTLALAYARALNRADRLDEAVSAYEGALALRPGDQLLQRELSDLYARRGQTDRALALAGQAAASTNDLVAKQQLGRAQEAAGDMDGAEATYRGILSQMPQAHLTRGLLAEVLFKQGKQQEALSVFRDGLQRDGSAALLQRGLGSMLERTGHPAEAAAAYREYARLWPEAKDSAQLQQRAGLLEQSVATP